MEKRVHRRRPSYSVANDVNDSRNMKKIEEFNLADRRAIVSRIAEQIKISAGTVWNTINEYL